jgi:ABC-type glycerol-3-phosphate transport system substrate-binding protein
MAVSIPTLSRRRFLLGAASAGVAFSGFSCSNHEQAQRKDKVRVMALPWMFGKYPIREAKERFEKRHPGVEVELLKSPGESCQKLLVAMLSGRSDCDVLLGANETDVINFAARDLLLPWDDFIASNPNLSRDRFVSTFFDMVNFGGIQYALPVSGELICLSVNKKMAREAGLLNDNGRIRFAKTWSETFDYAKRLSVDLNGDGKVDRYGLAINWSFGEHIFFAAVNAAEGRIRTPNNEILCDVPAVREMMALSREAASKGYLNRMPDEPQC